MSYGKSNLTEICIIVINSVISFDKYLALFRAKKSRKKLLKLLEVLAVVSLNIFSFSRNKENFQYVADGISLRKKC